MREGRTFDEHQAAWAAVLCEVGEMVRDKVLFSQHRGTDLHNPLLEAMLIHARALIEFLVGRRRKDGTINRDPRDIQPDDFVQGWAPDSLHGTDGEAVRRLIADLPLIDSTLSHISWERADRGEEDKVQWEYERVPADVLMVFAAYVQLLDAQEHTNSQNLAAGYQADRERHSPE